MCSALRSMSSRWILLASVDVGVLAAVPASAGTLLTAGDLVLSSSSYTGSAGSNTVGQLLPGSGTKGAVANGSYPGLFGNATVDASFGIASALFLTPYSVTGTIAAPVFTAKASIDLTALTGVSTSFPSKSEGALNLSSDGQHLTFVDYLTKPLTLDVSNANTPGIAEPGNYTANATARAVVDLTSNGVAAVLPTNAHPGNNGRAAVNAGNGTYILAGNAGNANGSPAVTAAAGVQTLKPATAASTSGALNTVQTGSFNFAATPSGMAIDPATITAANPGGSTYGSQDKAAKDNNFRGLTIANNTLYVTKGSGGNGVDTVYQVGAVGILPASGADITVLPGFPTTATKLNNFYTFGLFFADATTLYVADEGAGAVSKASIAAGALSAADLAAAAGDPLAGLGKYKLVNGGWVLEYTLQAGLGLGQTYTVSGTTLGGDTGSYTAATGGLRNLAGKVNADGTVSLYAVSATISTGGDQGADPNKLFEINDLLSATKLPSAESFVTVEAAGYGQVLRGVNFAQADAAAVPEPASVALLGLGLAGFGVVRRRA